MYSEACLSYLVQISFHFYTQFMLLSLSFHLKKETKKYHNIFHYCFWKISDCMAFEVHENNEKTNI